MIFVEVADAATAGREAVRAARVIAVRSMFTSFVVKEHRVAHRRFGKSTGIIHRDLISIYGKQNIRTALRPKNLRRNDRQQIWRNYEAE